MLDALIPYIPTPEHTIAENVPLIGVFKLQPFGPLVAVGVILGWRRCLAYAKHKDIDEFLFRDYLFWMLVAAFVISHWVSVIFYFPEQIAEDPWVLLYIWNGLSSVGGFFGAFIGMTVYLKMQKQPIMVYADATIYGLLLGWVFGRAGCSIVHDHPGLTPEDGAEPSWLMVGPWPDGAYRYDLGLLEFFFAGTLCLFVYVVVDWRKKKPGWLVGLVALAYAPYRFLLDFFRAADVRYYGLTTAQYFTIAFAFVGIWLLFIRRERKSDLAYATNRERIEREQAEKAREDAEDSEDDDSGDRPVKKKKSKKKSKKSGTKAKAKPSAKAKGDGDEPKGDGDKSKSTSKSKSKPASGGKTEDKGTSEDAAKAPSDAKGDDAAPTFKPPVIADLEAKPKLEAEPKGEDEP